MPNSIVRNKLLITYNHRYQIPQADQVYSYKVRLYCLSVKTSNKLLVSLHATKILEVELRAYDLCRDQLSSLTLEYMYISNT